MVPTEVRHPLLLILKEALTNVVKHAAATEVRISLDIVDSKLRLAVEDNGRGFDPQSVRSGSNGLANMRARVAKHSGRCEVISQPGRGTRVQVEVALAQTETHA
jgi:signal transduction histidine kinase